VDFNGIKPDFREQFSSNIYHHMARFLDIEKVIFPERTGTHKENFLFTFKTKKHELSAFLDESDAKKIYDDLRNKLGLSSEIGLSEKEIEEIVEFQNSNPNLCFSCKFRMKECDRCVMVCESPIERDLFLGLRNAGMNPLLQVWIAKSNGMMYPRDSKFSPGGHLTRPDFYFENEKGKFCIYADGFTYHNKSEEKVGKDRYIDSQLQDFGYRVLRYPGKRIREDLGAVVYEIRNAVMG